MPRKGPMWKRHVIIPGPGASVEGHIRFSDENQRDTLTFESQKRGIIDFCSRRQWNVLSWSVEDSISGGAETIQERPQWASHIAKIGKEIQVSVCIDLSRWSRDPGSIYESLRRIREQGGYWITCDEQHALDRIESDYGAQFGLAVSAVTAKQQLSATSIRTHMGKVTRARKGLGNGPVMFGYKRAPIPPPPPDYDRMTYRVTERLPAIPDDYIVESVGMTRFDLLMKMGELRAEGFSYGRIAEWLNERGVTPTFRQNHRKRLSMNFTIIAVQNIMQSLFPREFVRADGVPSGHGTLRDPETDQLLEGGHVAAWSIELCARIDQVDEDRRFQHTASRDTLTERKRTGYYNSIVRPYSGLLVCADCGSPLQVHTTTLYQDTAYRIKLSCSAGGGGNIDELSLDVSIYWLLHATLHENQLKQIEQSAQKYTQRVSQDIDPVVEVRIIELRAERERWLKLYAKGLITEDEVTEQLITIKRQLEDLQISTKSSRSQVTVASILAAGKQWLQISELWEAMTPAERGKMLSFMFESRSIAVNIPDRIIAKVRPKPPFDTIISAVLGNQPDNEGWIFVPLPDMAQHGRVIMRFAAQYGVAPSPRLLGISRRGKWYIPPHLKEQMRQLRKQGSSYKDIAKICCVSLDTVRKYAEG